MVVTRTPPSFGVPTGSRATALYLDAVEIKGGKKKLGWSGVKRRTGRPGQNCLTDGIKKTASVLTARPQNLTGGEEDYFMKQKLREGKKSERNPMEGRETSSRGRMLEARKATGAT